MRLIFRLIIITMAGIFAGCVMPSAIKPGATADELTQKLGKPTTVRPASQGGESWDYAYGPEGVETWRFDVDQGRVVRASTQLLTQERLQRVVPGVSTEADVSLLLGVPREIVALGAETIWEWRVALPPEYGVFVVRFDRNGKATGINVLKDFLVDGDKDAGP